MDTSERPGEGGDAHGDFDQFFRQIFPKAIVVAQRVTDDRDAAEDAALEALAKAHLRWDRIGREQWRDAWVLRVAINEAIRRLPKPLPLLAAASTGDPSDDVALRQTMTAALQELSKRQREVIVLRYLLGLSETQVADALHLSHGTVKTHLRRGIGRLRATVGRELKEEHLVRLA